MTADAPRIVREHALDYCAAAAAQLLRDREARYPGLVEQGTLLADAAANGIGLMRAIVAQWKWVVDPARPPAPAFDPVTGDFGAFNYLLAAEMDKVAKRARDLAHTSPGHFATAEMADLCEALAWYQHDVAATARIVVNTIALRRSPDRKAA